MNGLPKGPSTSASPYVEQSSHDYVVWQARHIPGQTRALSGLQDIAEHQRRRDAWNRGLNTESLKGYEEALEKRVSQLFEELSKSTVEAMGANGEGETIDISTWFNHFA